MSIYGLVTSSLYNDIEEAKRLETAWQSIFTDKYYTILRSSCGRYYVTNRFDPRVAQWCKDNNVVPEDR